MTYPRIEWPEGKRFAFTVFDDTDYAALENTKPVYDLLAELGFRTTKSAWPLQYPGGWRDGGFRIDVRESGLPTRVGSRPASPGLEIDGYHLASSHTTPRSTKAALGRFRQLFGNDLFTMSNHSLNREGIYSGHRPV